MTVLSQMQFPGTEHLNRPAEPWEQTPSQFMNRPDVYVHGRYTTKTRLNDIDVGEEEGLHAGTKQAATERVTDLGPARFGTSPRFFYGRVDPSKMRNTRDTPIQDAMSRDPDIDKPWNSDDLDHYYHNDAEDKGSTSVILSHFPQVNRPANFTTHRRNVSDAIQAGAHVPAHVRGPYEASGGAGGPEGYHDPELMPRVGFREAGIQTPFYGMQESFFRKGSRSRLY